MRILFDTNILIYREDDRILSSDIQELQQLLNRVKATILVHPLSLVELENDKDKSRKEKIKSKIKTYVILAEYPEPDNDSDFLKTVGVENNKNNAIDTVILYAMYRNAADFLITEDRDIHKKAARIGIGDRVLLIADAIQIFKGYLPREELRHPLALEKVPVYTLDINDPIFDSLKAQYSEFETKWFPKISKEGREGWVYYRYANSGTDKKIGALLIYNIEDEAIDSIPPFPKERRLKINTFKVTHIGHKIGELFIKLSIDYAIQNEISSIYLTHFTEKEDPLVDLISHYGFVKVAINSRGEDIYTKELIIDKEKLKSLSPMDITRQFYPIFYDGPNVKKFAVPIYPQFHDMLFTDYAGRVPTPEEHSGELLTEGNAITKAYLCHSQIRKIKSGDLLLFYRTSPSQVITSIGVVESVYPGMYNSDEIMNLVAKRTVFSKEEIDGMRKPLLIILFRHHFHFKNNLTLVRLMEMGILSGAPQSISEISHENYLRIKEKGYIDGRYTVD